MIVMVEDIAAVALNVLNAIETRDERFPKIDASRQEQLRTVTEFFDEFVNTSECTLKYWLP